MTRTRPLSAEPVVAAQSTVDSLVLAHDRFAQTAADVFWEFSRTDHNRVVELLRATADADILAAVDDVATGTASRIELEMLTDALARRFATGAEPWRGVAAAALAADASSRLSMHLGGPGPIADRCAEAVTADDLCRAGIAGDGADDDARILVVIPFRDADPAGSRLRNLLACLASLADQSVPRSTYRCVVVETDSEPRHEQAVTPLVDRYLYARSDRRFNKSWAVNIGATVEAGAAEILCILDGDILVDRDFVRRNAERFTWRGAQAHWPYTDALCLDAESTHHAIRRRCFAGDAGIDLAGVRGVYLRRPPGHCVWLRMPLFRAVRGMDERFEGWGGEDLDFAFRVQYVASFDRYRDPLLHMFHPRPAVRENGTWFFAHRRFLSWRPVEPIGRIDRPARSLDDVPGVAAEPAPAGANPDAILS